MAAAAGSARTVTAKIPGFVRQDVKVKQGERFEQDLKIMSNPLSPKGLWNAGKWYRKMEDRRIPVHDAREEESKSGLSKSEFFNKYGFVLLSHKTSMTPDQWKNQIEVKRVYGQEVTELIQHLVGNSAQVHFEDSYLVVRGGKKGEEYASEVHADNCETLPELQRSLKAYYGPDVTMPDFQQDTERLMVIDLWRPILPMKGPVLTTPLAMAAKYSVTKDEDVVPSLLLNYADTGLPVEDYKLKYSDRQKWFYYPEMTTDEVIVMVHFDRFRDEQKQQQLEQQCFPIVFHTAFRLDNPPKHAEPRVSAEYRVVVNL
eukprot:Clim_evm4s244 gene=Clim_evmTU4s244